MKDSAPRRNPLEQLLRLFADVRGGEGSTVLLLALNIFLIFSAYYIIKPVRESLILAVPAGDQIKSYASAGQVLLLAGLVPLYAKLVTSLPRRTLLISTTLFFSVNMLLFYLAIKALGVDSTALAVGFYLWVGVFNLMIPAQFWSFANDVYTVDQGKRLFAIVAFGASAGAVLGSDLTGRLVEPLGVDEMLLVSAGILTLSLVVNMIVERREPVLGAEAPAPEKIEQDTTPNTKGAFQLILSNRYLLLIAMLLLFLNWVNTTGEYILGRAVKEYAEGLATERGLSGDAWGDFLSVWIGEFYSGFFRVVNLLSLFMQLFLVSRIIKYIGVRTALLILPLIAFAGYAFLAFAPVLSIIRWAKTAENATDYSLHNTLRHSLFLPTTREEKYKAKQGIDTFFVRAGDVLSAVLVFFGAQMLNLSTSGFAIVNLGLVCIWLFLAVSIGREFKRKTESLEV